MDNVRLFDRVIGLLMVLSMLAINVLYTNYVNHRSQARQCEFARLELDLYAENPPDTKVRQARFEAYDRLWKQHCS